MHLAATAIADRLEGRSNGSTKDLMHPKGGSMTDEVWGEDEDDTTYAQGRTADRTYVSKSFTINRESSRDFGHPARFVHKVFDTDAETAATFDGSEWTLSETTKGRYQFKLLIARKAGQVNELWIQRVPATGSSGKVTVLLNLRRPEVERLVDLLKHLEVVPVTGEATVRVDDALVRDLFANPNALISVYKRDPEHFRRLISDDESARDVVAIAHRRAQVEHFHRLLEDDEYFDSEVQLTPRRQPEHVWQRFFEANPWMLGVTLAGQLLTSWNEERLEQVVVGASISSVGKRTDALLRTSGRIRSMVFAEIKTHRAKLLSKSEPPYRSGCWAPSDDLAGGVAQVQGTVHRAVRDISDRLAEQGDDGSDVLGDFTYLVRPRSFLIIGNLNELVGTDGGHHADRIRSFELCRRHLIEPEVITFDELLARAEWVVDTAVLDVSDHS